MNKPVEKTETDLLLEAVFRRYGYDFRSYARASIERRVRLFMATEGFATMPELTLRVPDDRELFSRLARSFSVPVTELFRDPQFYRAVRERVLPLLRTWPHFKIWHAGCATGEEVYSLAILLKEEGLYDRATIYATDFNDEALDLARAGVYEADNMKAATRNYQAAGGKASFSEYYHCRYGSAAMNPELKGRLVFTNHNLASDGVFGETHLVFCRNVLIYFNRALQNRALRLFSASLVNGGFLCLGAKEDLRFSEVNGLYEVADKKARIYKRNAAP